MKTIVIALGLLAACVRAGYAVEYVTLFSGEEVTVDPTSKIEVVTNPDNYYKPSWTLTFNRNVPGAGNTREQTYGSRFDNPVVGVVKVKNNGSGPSYGTLKITPANEINVVAPTSLLVIPENSTGNYNIVVETSDDTATWTPFHSQTVSANDAKRFFRTRIVKAQ